MKYRYAAAFTAVMLLSGCFDLRQDFKFASDGTATVDMKLAIDAALVAMTQKEKNEDWCKDQFPGKDGISISVSQSLDKGDIVCQITISGQSDDVLAILDKSEENGVSASADAPNQILTLQRSDDNYELNVEIPSMKGINSLDAKDEMTSTIQAMMLAKMSGRALSWSVSAPKILETTGTISDDGTVAHYSRPLADAFTSDEPTRFRTVFSLKEPGLFDRFMSIFQ